MSPARPRFVIVGGNLTGGAAVTTLRTEGFDGAITMIGAEPHPPYERPPLSKEYLRGEKLAEAALLHPAGWYEENDIELLLSRRATSVDSTERQVILDDGESVLYDKLLIATGGRNRRFPTPGRDLEGVHDLRTFEDADRIRNEAITNRRVVIIGAGFIGCEVAASLRTLGLEVDVVEFLELPLVRALGPELGRVYEAIHRDEGVRLHLGQGVERFEGGARVERVATTTGAVVECDFAVVGVGIEPVTDPVQDSGVEIRNGIVVDQFCRTSAPRVFAAGDVANHYHPLFEMEMRVEHWDNALKQGAAAARNMMGAGEPFDDPHWFWSDQYDHNLQFMGWPVGYDELVVRGSLEGRSFTAFYLRDGIVVAAAGLNRGNEVRRSAALIRARVPVEPGLLRDEDVDLRKLATGTPMEP
jgi:3-phenylpropionate/trans-cinnamate dioxygenase ferredoxin reductase subunit